MIIFLLDFSFLAIEVLESKMRAKKQANSPSLLKIVLESCLVNRVWWSVIQCLILDACLSLRGGQLADAAIFITNAKEICY